MSQPIRPSDTANEIVTILEFERASSDLIDHRERTTEAGFSRESNLDHTMGGLGVTANTFNNFTSEHIEVVVSMLGKELEKIANEN